MKLLLDQNLSPRLARALGAIYPGSTHVREVGLQAADDDTVWAYAAEQGFVIVSKDADFHQRSFVLGHPPGARLRLSLKRSGLDPLHEDSPHRPHLGMPLGEAQRVRRGQPRPGPGPAGACGMKRRGGHQPAPTPLKDHARPRVAEAEGEVAYAQRLGYLLELVRRPEPARPLAEWVAARATRIVPLTPGQPMTGAPRDARWRLAVNDDVEPDEGVG